MSNDMNYVVAFDFGTSGVKAVLVDFNGKICGCGSATYSLLRPHANWAEQVPTEYWDGCCMACSRLMNENSVDPKRVKAIVFATQWKGMIPLDKDDNILFNSIIWLDKRAGEQAQRLGQVAGRKIQINDYWPRVLWFKENHPDLFAKTTRILEANSFLKWRACGKLGSDNSNNFFFSNLERTDDLFRQVFDKAGIDRNLFPPVVKASDEIGSMTKEAADRMGLCEGTKVFGGLCDIPAVAAGSGAGSIGGVHIYLGSSGWIAMTRSVEDNVPQMPIILAPDRWIHISGMTSVCLAFDWCIRNFYRKELADMGGKVYDLVESELEKIPAGSEGLTAISALNGEGSPFAPGMRAGFLGLNANHTRAHMVNAVQECICNILRLRKESLEKGSGKKITVVNTVGGGSLSSHWMQTLANVLDVTVRVPKDARFSGALGAAYCALIGLGVCDGFDGISSIIEYEKIYEPDESLRPVYDEQFSRFTKAYQLLGEF